MAQRARPGSRVPVQHDGMWRPSFRRAEAFSQGRASLVRSEAGPVYRVVRKLRDSLFGKVYQGQLCYVDGEGRVQPRPGAMVALKILSIAHVRARRTMDGHRVDEDALQEMAFMQQLSNPGHPNLLRLFECLEDRRHYYMVMEFVDGGELYDVLNEQGRLNEAHAKHILRQLALGLAHLHARSVAHRDISLENAMVTSDGSVKVIDFGLAARVPRGEDGRHALFAPPFRSGKRTYQPPEVIEMMGPYDAFAFDRWSLGIIAFCITVGNPPFEKAHISDFNYRFVQERSLAHLLHGWGIGLPSAACLDFCEALMRVQPPADRLPLEDCVNHPWFSEQ